MTDPADDTLKTTTLETSAVLCSICLDAIAAYVDRSTAKLQCGHEFHLDCIGSAFNMKGAMQCPNCRKVERGRWLYASGSTCSVAEISMDDWTLHENQYGLGFPETPYNIHWCPFSGLARVHSAFEALESLPPAYHDLHRHHNMFAEHGAVPSMAHSYIAYFRPVPSASSIANETIEDLNFGYQWNGVSNPHVFPVTDMHYHNGVHQNSQSLSPNNAHANSNDLAPVAPVTLRSTRGDFGAMARSGSFMHPSLYGHGSRPHERLQPPRTIHNPHQPANPLGMPSAIIPGMARFHGRRSLPQPPVPTNSVSNRNGGFFIFPTQGSPAPSSLETENSLPVVSSDRNSGWISFNNGAAGSDSNRTGNFWHGHWS